MLDVRPQSTQSCLEFCIYDSGAGVPIEIKDNQGSSTIPSGHFETQDKQRGLIARMLSSFREGDRWTLDILRYEDI